MSNQGLYGKLDQTCDVLSTKLIELVKLSSIDGPEGDGSDAALSEASIATTGVMLVNSQTMQLIKRVQDLFILTRSIREKWLLNQIPERSTQQGVGPAELEQLLDQCMQQIAGDTDVELNRPLG
ncbi:Srb6p TDEL_0H02730 [Torulaspora delbrueckii]|uniref:Mediator of RNA polymerase II transcription subunit 22 n=1 Tax=Torulaspora delbrueckii TaxID=4950 RepID=G8ZZT8_TORDE|nr:hypothetical protein TDEL_0H02730 [Torulaspora delbrueckii]CCE94132.1 hypothetical protein TDEL_0H02730 [Torulaspora delbrueckii]